MTTNPFYLLTFAIGPNCARFMYLRLRMTTFEASFSVRKAGAIHLLDVVAGAKEASFLKSSIYAFDFGVSGKCVALAHYTLVNTCIQGHRTKYCYMTVKLKRLKQFLNRSYMFEVLKYYNRPGGCNHYQLKLGDCGLSYNVGLMIQSRIRAALVWGNESSTPSHSLLKY